MEVRGQDRRLLLGCSVLPPQLLYSDLQVPGRVSRDRLPWEHLKHTLNLQNSWKVILTEGPQEAAKGN